MRTAIPFFLCGAVLVGCTKPDDQVAPVVNSCGSDGQRIEISVDNNGWCANASVSAMASPDGQALISGLALNGQMFTLAIDSMAIGTFIIDDMDNITTWTEVGMPSPPWPIIPANWSSRRTMPPRTASPARWTSCCTMRNRWMPVT